MNVYLDTKNSSSSFNSVLCFYDQLFESPVGMSGKCEKYLLDKTELVSCFFESLLICKKGYLLYLFERIFNGTLGIPWHNLR